LRSRVEERMARPKALLEQSLIVSTFGRAGHMQ
jgi:hypothetical protein